MIGIGELVLLILAFLFAAGAISRLARWAFFRRASGAKQVLWVLADWIKKRSEAHALDSADMDTQSVSAKNPDTAPSRPEAGGNEEPPGREP